MNKTFAIALAVLGILTSCLKFPDLPKEEPKENISEDSEEEDRLKFGWGLRYNVGTGGIDLGFNINGVGGFGGRMPR